MKLSIKLSLINLVLVLVIYSCKKDTGPIAEAPAPNNPTMPTTAPDSVYHKILNPYFVLNPITNLISHPSGCGYVFNPHDSITTYDLDLDSNGVGDLHFLSKSYYEFHSASYPCANYLRGTFINAFSATDSVGWMAPLSALGYETPYCSLGDTIGVHGKFTNQYTFSGQFFNWGTVPIAIHGGDDFYLPLKRVLNNKTMYGWVRIDTVGYGGIIIKEYAINSTNNNQIICGQTH